MSRVFKKQKVRGSDFWTLSVQCKLAKVAPLPSLPIANFVKSNECYTKGEPTIRRYKNQGLNPGSITERSVQTSDVWTL
jgi:hypothetical protein